MARSLSLALHLFLARFRGRRRGLPKALPHPDLAARPEGELIWMHIEAPAQWLSFAHLSRQMAEVRPGLQFLVTGTRPSTAPNFPSGTLVLGVPAETHPDVAAFLDHMRPDLVVLTALSLPPLLISAAAARGIALVLADIQYSGATRPWRWNRSMARALLGHFALIMTRDTASARQIERSCRNRVEATVTGRIEETTQPLPHDEAERAAMAEIIGTRPTWLAAACPPEEEDAVITAHARAMRHAHRILMILVPADPSSGARLAQRLAEADMTVALRSRDEDPADDVQVLVADTDGEMGLWYRLAPLVYMGGTLSASGTGRGPFEPAALGSAIVHGPHPGPHPEAYARLAEVFAARLVVDPETLATAVTELIAPDKAAYLAHNAWAASSGGAEVTERVMRLLFDQLDLAKGRG